MRTSHYNVIIKLSEEDEEQLLFHGYSGAVDIVSKEIVEALRALEEEKKLPRTPKSEMYHLLQRRGYITEKSQKEEEAKLVEIVRAIHKIKRRLSFLVIPSYSCNLRCSYCYQWQRFLESEEQRRPGRIMSQTEADKAFDAMCHLWKKWEESLQEEHKLKPEIAFYGGEPFLVSNYNIVSYIIEKGLRLGFTFSAITNGTQVDKFLPLFRGPEIFKGFQITLDGPPEIHNKRRIYANGKGTFEEISRNISLLLERGYKVDVRINTDAKNIYHIKELAELIEKKGWRNYSNFNAYCALVHLEGGRRCIEAPLFSKKLIEILGKKHYLIDYGNIYRMFRRIFEAGGRPDFDRASCSAIGRQFIFDPYGKLYACWDSAGFPSGKIGRYVPKLELDEGFLRWKNRNVAEIPQCRTCAYALLCKGGCAQYAYDTNGSLYSPHCDGFPKEFEYQVKLAYRDFRRRQARGSALAQEGLHTPIISSQIIPKKGFGF